MKLCIDCRHYRSGEGEGAVLDPDYAVKYSVCGASGADDPLSLIDGRPPKKLFCTTQRSPGMPCGPDGALWEGKDRADGAG